MRFLFITNDFSRIHLVNLAKVLKGDHEVDLVSFDVRNDPYSNGKDTVYNDCDFVSFHKRPFIVKVIRSLLKRVPFFVEGCDSKDMHEVINLRTQRNKYDAVLIEQLAMAQYVSSVMPGLTKVLFAVDCMTRVKMQRYHAESNILKRLIFYLDYLMTSTYEKYICDEFDAVILVSSHDIDYASSKGLLNKDGIYHLPIRVDTGYYRPIHGSKDVQRSIAFVGLMADFKSEHAVLWFYNYVWSKLKIDCPGIKFIVVGKNPSAAIRKLSLVDNQVIVTGYVDDIRPYVLNSDLFVSPLQIGTGMKNRILEAMAMGKAIVASHTSIEGIEVKDGNNILIARDANQFTSYVLKLLNDGELAKQLGIEARLCIEKSYSLNNLAAEFVDIITEVTTLNQGNCGPVCH